MALKGISKDYINENVVIYPFEEIDRNLNREMHKSQEYDIIHNGNFQKLLMSDFNKKLLPYVNEVLDEYEYDGSVVYDEYISRHAIFVAVTRVIEKLREQEYFEELMLDDFDEIVDRYMLLRADVETMLLSELFFMRRVKYAKEGLMKYPEKAKAPIIEMKNIYLENEYL